MRYAANVRRADDRSHAQHRGVIVGQMGENAAVRLSPNIIGLGRRSAIERKTLGDRFQSGRRTGREHHTVLVRAGVQQRQNAIANLIDEVLGVLGGVRIGDERAAEQRIDGGQLRFGVERGASMVQVDGVWNLAENK